MAGDLLLRRQSILTGLGWQVMGVKDSVYEFAGTLIGFSKCLMRSICSTSFRFTQPLLRQPSGQKHRDEQVCSRRLRVPFGDQRDAERAPPKTSTGSVELLLDMQQSVQNVRGPSVAWRTSNESTEHIEYSYPMRGAKSMPSIATLFYLTEPARLLDL